MKILSETKSTAISLLLVPLLASARAGSTQKPNKADKDPYGEDNDDFFEYKDDTDGNGTDYSTYYDDSYWDFSSIEESTTTEAPTVAIYTNENGTEGGISFVERIVSPAKQHQFLELEEGRQVEVQTDLGKITGERITRGGEVFYAFKGIPYAKPPVGDLRFMPPEPILETPWPNNGRLDGTLPAAKCAQIQVLGFFIGSFQGEEDCLYLNIFTPVVYLPDKSSRQAPSSEKNNDIRLPVMVWIHGGSFIAGAATDYVPAPLMRHDVIVVSISYRLGPLGFLSFGNGVVSGNMAIRDQLAAIRWIKRHIASFGGDPDRITVFGESAGAICAQSLYLSPQAKGLVSGIIAQSGSVLMTPHWGNKHHQRALAKDYVARFGCPSELDSETLSCLQRVNTSDIVTLANVLLLTDLKKFSLTSEDFRSSIWWPVVDDHAAADPVLPVEPYEALTHGQFNQIPMMTGTVKNEGGLFSMLAIDNPNLPGMWRRFGPALVQVSKAIRPENFTEVERLQTNVLSRYYLGPALTDAMSSHKVTRQEMIRRLTDILTDTLFLAHDQTTAQLINRVSKNKVYNYHLGWGDKFTTIFLYGVTDRSLTPVHGDELGYLFDFSILGQLTANESLVADKMARYWTNFAKYGDPSPFLESDLPLWLPYDDKKSYLAISPDPEMRENIYPERMFFVQSVLYKNRKKEMSSSISNQKSQQSFATTRSPTTKRILAPNLFFQNPYSGIYRIAQY